ncbi:receptor-type tyrosine-protein kinase FLT3 isoform X2 [Ascaphus truei]|uniref:receptor-type tyrosine-protein kinase FLT3 isoform X2 n=1 Tax=Ascaphus truei TaxID=8439 RepID=UPI003F5A9F7D
MHELRSIRTSSQPGHWLQVAIIFITLSAVTNQNSSAISCFLIQSNTETEEVQPAEYTMSNSLNTNTNLECHLSSWSSQYIYKAAVTVEVNVFHSVELKVMQNISGIVSCIWSHRQSSKQCSLIYTSENSIVSLELLKVTDKDAGEYELSIKNEDTSYTVYFAVRVRSKPRKPYFKEYERRVTCISRGYPPPSVQWLFCISPNDRCGNRTGIILYKDMDSYGVQRVEHTMRARKLLEEHIWCCAGNDFGRECTQLYTLDLRSVIPLPEIFVKVGEPFIMRCRARYKTFHFNIKWSSESENKLWWFEESEYVTGPAMVRVLFASAHRMEKNNSGNYTCVSSTHPSKSAIITLLDRGFIDLNTSSEEHEIDTNEEFCFVAVFKAYPAVTCVWYYHSTSFPCDLLNTENGYSMSKYCNHNYVPGEYIFYVENGDVHLNKTFTLNILQKPKVHITSKADLITCVSYGYPISTLTWKKSDDVSFNCTDDIMEGITYGIPERKIDNWKSNSTVDLTNMTGTFSVCCCAMNSAGSSCENTFKNVKSIQQVQNNFIFPIATGCCALCIVLLIALVFNKYKKQYRYESQLQMIQYIGPSDNEYIYIDFSVLEYDLKWEFPTENLELGKVLGSGAFGKVLNATAYGISKPGVSIQVAVKMLKEKPDVSEKDALMSELKMMTQIGHHENIVNLLGACTLSGPIYLIFEYCCHGDLLNYLRSKRETFHRTWTDVVMDNNFSFYHNFHQDQKSSVRAGISASNGSNTTISRTQEFEQTRQGQEVTLSSGHSEILQHDMEMKYENTRSYDDEEDLNVLTFEDLLCFSYQVAKGMEFLESKLCIHRDLAARNILVTHGKMAKICDFGLARDVINDTNYVVKGNARLPVKWMAPESIFEGIYTIKSDVWSYGILLWEIFSLGVNPYPGMQVDANFYKLLQSGFKMDQPFYATDEIYFLMQSCWAFDSRKRPCFPQLVSFLGYQLSNTEALVYQNMDNTHCKDDSSRTSSLNGVNFESISEDAEGDQEEDSPMCQ